MRCRLQIRKQNKYYAQSPQKEKVSECSSFNRYTSGICQYFIWTLYSPTLAQITVHATLRRWKELFWRFCKCQCLTIIKDVFCVGWSRQILRSFPLYSIVIMSNAIASGTASITDKTQISTISTAVHFGTPIPLMRLQEATARYLKQQHTFAKNMRKPTWFNWQPRLFMLYQHSRKANLSPYWKAIKRVWWKNGSHLSILRAHKLSTVMPTDAFWMKGTNLHISTPKGQSSASSCEKKTIRNKLGLKNNSQSWNTDLCLDWFFFSAM